MTKTENTISEVRLLSIMKVLEGKENASDMEIVSFVSDVNSLMADYRVKFKSEKSESTTMEDCENAADSIIDLAHTIIMGGPSCFDLPSNQLKHIKNQFLKTIISDSPTLNEAFSWNFTILLLNNFKTMQSMRKINTKDN